ncbi:MAG: hypothetical protein HC802_06100 [Caldilineaceae bacterium]|nr:hypothetical protein [Caldilineaceae bacterium]
MTTTIRVREPVYVGVRVKTQIVATEFGRPEVVVARVEEALRQYISPLQLVDPDASNRYVEAGWDGWPFGKSLYVAEIYSLLQQVPGVRHILDVEFSHRTVLPNKEIAPLGQLEEQIAAIARAQGEAALTAVRDRVLHVTPDTVLCSLDHQVEVVEL